MICSNVLHCMTYLYTVVQSYNNKKKKKEKKKIYNTHIVKHELQTD